MKTILRIKRPKEVITTAAAGAVPKNYLERLVALIPAEVIGLYLGLVNLISAASGTVDKGIDITDNHWLPFLGLALVLFVRIMETKATVTRENGKKALDIEWQLVIISAVSFIIWVYATGGSFFKGDIELFGRIGIGVVVAVWTFLVPYFYKEEK
jgi:hypothetical protein